jgi:hypothetical protein
MSVVRPRHTVGRFRAICDTITQTPNHAFTAVSTSLSDPAANAPELPAPAMPGERLWAPLVASR